MVLAILILAVASLAIQITACVFIYQTHQQVQRTAAEVQKLTPMLKGLLDVINRPVDVPKGDVVRVTDEMMYLEEQKERNKRDG